MALLLSVWLCGQSDGGLLLVGEVVDESRMTTMSGWLTGSAAVSGGVDDANHYGCAGVHGIEALGYRFDESKAVKSETSQTWGRVWQVQMLPFYSTMSGKAPEIPMTESLKHKHRVPTPIIQHRRVHLSRRVIILAPFIFILRISTETRNTAHHHDRGVRRHQCQTVRNVKRSGYGSFCRPSFETPSRDVLQTGPESAGCRKSRKR